MNLLIPERTVAVAHRFDVARPLSDQLVGGKPVELQAALLRKIEVAVVRDIAEHARRDNVVEIVPVRMALGNRWSPREGQPACKGLVSVEPTVAASKPVAAMNGICIPPKSILEPSHTATLSIHAAGVASAMGLHRQIKPGVAGRLRTIVP